MIAPDVTDPAAKSGFGRWGVFLVLMFGLPASACTSIGVWHLPELRHVGVVPLAQVGDARVARSGAHLTAVGGLTLVARDELPLDGKVVVDDKGAALYVAEGENPSSAQVLVYAPRVARSASQIAVALGVSVA